MATLAKVTANQVPGVVALMADFIGYVEKVRGFSSDTVRTYSYFLESFFKPLINLDIQQLTLKQVDDYIAMYANTHELKPQSTNTLRCVLRAFFLYVERYRSIRLSFDYSMLRASKAPRARISPIEIPTLQMMISRLHTNQDKVMMLTMYSSGMRIGELVKFAVEDFNGLEIRVRGKGSKDRSIPIDESMRAILEQYIQDNSIRAGIVFRHQVSKDSLPNQAYTVSGLRKRWQRQLGPYGLYQKPHDLRHGIATQLLINGMDIRSLQTFLGHNNIATTMLYTHITDSHLRESVQKCFPSIQLNAQELIKRS